MLGRIMPLEALCDPPGFSGWKSLIERCRHMGIQIVLNQDNDFSIGKMNIAELLKHHRVVDGGAPRSDFDMAPAFQGCKDHEQIGGAIAFIFVIDAGRPSRHHRYRRAGFGGQLFGCFIQTDKPPGGVVGAGIDRQNIFHGGDEGSIRLRWNDPVFV